MFRWGCPREVLSEVVLLLSIPQETVLESLIEGVGAGHQATAAYFIERDVKGGAMASAFNRYHHEALIRGSQQWKDPIREARYAIV